MSALREYLIKRTDGSFLDLPKSSFDSVLRPNSIPSEPVARWGDHRIKVPGCEIAFSFEPPGLQVIFQDPGFPQRIADQIVDEIRQNITRETGHECAVVPLG